MDIINQIRYKASLNRKKIALCETGDIRTIKAAAFLADNQLADIVLIGSEQEIQRLAALESVKLPDSVSFVNIEKGERLDRYSSLYLERCEKEGVTIEQAQKVASDPLYFTALMVASGDADGAVAGAVHFTKDVMQAAFQCIGLRDESNIISSIFLMNTMEGENLTFGDCALVHCPDEQQMATIAIDSAATHLALTGEEPHVAMLSFSTLGSAPHELSEKVAHATRIVKERAPNLKVDGELQFDAAYVSTVAARKAPDSEVAGHANVFIFPNLDAANIASMLTERMAGAGATGPVFQGLKKPMNDLSRGCNWEDIVNTTCVTSLMAAEK